MVMQTASGDGARIIAVIDADARVSAYA